MGEREVKIAILNPLKQSGATLLFFQIIACQKSDNNIAVDNGRRNCFTDCF
jgi:hypothetical protein